LGDHWLSVITPSQLERVLDDLRRGQSPSGRALSGAAVNRYRARLSGLFKRALKAAGGRVSTAAASLGLSRKGLYLKRRRLELLEADRPI
jgi:transcriptional regulator of acetoin/glycerol metabolism